MANISDIETALTVAEKLKKLWDNRKSKKLDKIVDKVDSLDNTVKTMENKFDSKLHAVYSRIDENDIKIKRGNILTFADEIRRGLNHSKESYVQVLDDITKYDKYCKEHPDFENDRTNIAADVIRKSHFKKMSGEDSFLA